MTDIDLIKQALEFLEDNQHHIADNERHAYVMLYNDCITALKARLTQPPQRTEQEMDELQSLRQFRDAAFLAHPNIDLDIEAAHGIKEDT